MGKVRRSTCVTAALPNKYVFSQNLSCGFPVRYMMRFNRTDLFETIDCCRDPES